MAFHPEIESVAQIPAGQIVVRDSQGWMKGVTLDQVKTEISLQLSLDSKQPLSTILSAIASLLSSGAIELKSDGSAATITITPAARTLLDDVDYLTMRSTLGLGSAATLNTGTVSGTVAQGDAPIQAVATHETTANHPVATVSLKGMMSGADKTKLDGIAAGATVNSVDSSLRDRTTHTGMQAIATVSGLSAALDNKQQQSSNLTALAGTNTAGAIERAASGTYSTFVVTAAGKALIDDVDAAAQRTTLGLSNLANALQLIAANNLSDLVNPGVARTNLGLGTAAIESAANLRDRSSHTGFQSVSSITGLGDSAILNVGYSAGTVAPGDAITTHEAVHHAWSGKRTYRSRTAPTNPAVGDFWDELDASDWLIQEWFWGGSYWLSRRIIYKDPSVNNVNASTTIYYEIPSDYNIFVLFYKVNILIGGTNNALNYWTFNLLRSANSGNTTLLSSQISTANAATNAWFSSTQAINTHINIGATGAKAFQVALTKILNASNVVGSLQIAYRLARI